MSDKRIYGYDSFACICNAESCDVIEPIVIPAKGSFLRVISSREMHRFQIIKSNETKGPEETILKINFENEKQTILGFGGAFSDAMAISVMSLSKKAQDNLLRSYFSNVGLEYNVCRIPIAGCDFSTRPYSYNEIENDVEMLHFKLAHEDTAYKIPLIKRAQKMSNDEILLFGSAWSPPPWMKESNKFNGKGGLLRSMWDPFSRYLVRFVKEYEKLGVKLWGLTTINQPLAGFTECLWNACAFSADQMRDWVKTSFGPALIGADLQSLKLMTYDHNRNELMNFNTTVLNDKEVYQYIDGVAVHWYDDLRGASSQVLREFHEKFPDKFLLYTEACLGSNSSPEDKVQLGYWERAEIYAENIIDDLNNYVVGWVDWNMALDMQGGPNWAQNFVDAPILVNKDKDEFYKQPMFYALGHFSKFLKRGSTVVPIVLPPGLTDKVNAVAVVDRCQDSCIIVIQNKAAEKQVFSVEARATNYLNIEMEPKSIETIIFRI